jgi:hypothetical protein
MFVGALFANPAQKGLHLGMGLKAIQGIEFLGEGVVAKQRVNLAVAGATKLHRGARIEPPPLGILARNQVMFREVSHRTLA